jgi:hypothetical protein
LSAELKLWLIVGGIVVVVFGGLAVAVAMLVDRQFGGPVAEGPLTGDRTTVSRALLVSCRKQRTEKTVCECIADKVPRYLSDDDARALVRAWRARQPLPKDLDYRFVRSSIRAGAVCGIAKKR